jgi:hypothetical protein
MTEETAELMRSYQKAEQVSVKRVGRDVELDLDGMRFQIGQGIAEELLAGLSGVIRPYAGYSIFDRIVQEIDAVIDRLMSGDGAAEDGRDPGRAEAFCRALALIRNPYEPDWEAERDRQMKRWEQRNA